MPGRAAPLLRQPLRGGRVHRRESARDDPKGRAGSSSPARHGGAPGRLGLGARVDRADQGEPTSHGSRGCSTSSISVGGIEVNPKWRASHADAVHVPPARPGQKPDGAMSRTRQWTPDALPGLSALASRGRALSWIPLRDRHVVHPVDAHAGSPDLIQPAVGAHGHANQHVWQGLGRAVLPVTTSVPQPDTTACGFPPPPPAGPSVSPSSGDARIAQTRSRRPAAVRWRIVDPPTLNGRDESLRAGLEAPWPVGTPRLIRHSPTRRFRASRGRWRVTTGRRRRAGLAWYRGAGSGKRPPG